MAEQKITFDKLVRWVGSGSLVLAVLYITNYLSSVLLPFFIAWLFAYLLYPMVKFIQYRMKVKVRALAIIIAMLIVLSVIGLMIYFIIPPMIDQFQKLYGYLMHWLHQTTHTNDLTTLVKQWLEYNNSLARKVCTLHTAYQFLGLAREHRSAYHFYSTLAMLFAH